MKKNKNIKKVYVGFAADILNVAKMILKNQRSFEVEKKISSINEVINLI